MKFEWDTQKERQNIEKHKITFVDAGHVFADPWQLNLFDEDHSDDEDRWVVIGMIPDSSVLLVVHTIRISGNEQMVRIISARKATKRERETYFARRPR
ncbi:MAG: BrnT family toxin [Trichlorobacter sp.]|uniref:BrnT family toxin n=1 Tax=Trichlorobacter sp. TaxID=2911007 RepID=UPI0025689D43|nr:BrnT family toxin [Trichlorobacter sp.]MDK9718980.1 BrnT family toxin [Trichlorobacter sp.]